MYGNIIVTKSAYRVMIMGLLTLELSGLHPRLTSTAKLDISSSRTQRSQLIMPCEAEAITITPSSPLFKVGAWQVRNLAQKYSFSQEGSTQTELGRSARSGLRRKWAKSQRTI